MTPDNTLLVTVDSLRYDHYEFMLETKAYLGDTHSHAFATSTATAGSFQSIIGGYYPDGAGLEEGTSVATKVPTGNRVGITTNHLLSSRYGYDAGFNHFTAPSVDDDGLKETAQRYLTPGSLAHKIAVEGWNTYQRIQSVFATGSSGREYRPASDVIDEFVQQVEGEKDWFGWLHFMEPHHPYNPDDGPVDRVKAQAVSRRVLAGNGSESDKKLVRELYKQEIRELDRELRRLWEFVDDDCRIVFCADHGEFLGENDTWGHPGELRLETLHVPLATRNIPQIGDIVSLVDVPSILLGENHKEGTFEREVAFATYGKKKAAINKSLIRSDEGTFTYDGDEVTDSSLDRDYARFSSTGFVKEDAAIEDLEALGYI
jgi:arylsulfatase A-like enzyme